MYQNPILKNYKTKALYILAWALLSWLQISINAKYHQQNELLQYFIFDILLFNSTLALFLLFVWYPVQHVNWSAKYWYYYAAGHLACALIIAAICVCINKIIMWIVVDHYTLYIKYMWRIHLWRFIGSLTMYLLTTLTFYLYVFVKRLQEKQSNEIRLNQIIRTNELNLLKTQINPHFLFNSLNSLNSLIITDSEQAQKMLLALSDYLRYTVLSNNQPYASLEQEIANVERYLSVEKLRFGSRLDYLFSIPAACLKVQIPSMLLQPLFENAVKHSVYESLQQVQITARARFDGDTLELTITNPCDQQQTTKKGTGTGLSNIRERLWLTYEEHAGLHIKIDKEMYTATLRLPRRYS